MVFGDALELMKAGRRMRRASTNGIAVYVDYTKEMRPYLVFDSAYGQHIPSTVSNIDLFADDWEITDDD